MHRRSFIKSVSLLSATMLSSPIWAKAAPKNMVGLQLYTVRDIIGKDIKNIIAKASQIGYKVVETFDYSTNNKFFGLTAKEFSTLLKDYGMIAPSNHLGVDTLFKNGSLTEIERFIEASVELKSTYITIPSMDYRYRKTADDYKRHAETFNKAGELCNKAGMKMAYHNHEFEFKKFGDISGLEILLSETDPNLMHFELDIYWAARSKVDPFKFMKKHKGRFPLWHVKDMAKANIDHNTEIGNGTIDFVSLFKEAKNFGLKHAFVEQETNYVPDPMGSIKSSLEYLKKIV